LPLPDPGARSVLKNIRRLREFGVVLTVPARRHGRNKRARSGGQAVQFPDFQDTPGPAGKLKGIAPFPGLS